MNYYFYIRKNEIVGKGLCSCVDEDIQNIIVNDEMYNNSELYIWNGSEVVLNPDHEAEEAQRKTERLARLCITKADMERALVRAFYITFNDILEKAKVEQPDTWKFVEAELNAGYIYRGNEYVISFANKLGITSRQLDDFFIAATSTDQEIKSNAWKIIAPTKEEVKKTN